MEIIAAHCALAGADRETIRSIMDCVTVEEAIGIMIRRGINETVWESVGRKICFHLDERVKGRVVVEFIVFTQEHGVLARGKTGDNDRKGNKWK
jgi:cobalt-precorrin-5B (C1)-methyltransferase